MARKKKIPRNHEGEMFASMIPDLCKALNDCHSKLCENIKACLCSKSNKNISKPKDETTKSTQLKIHSEGETLAG